MIRFKASVEQVQALACLAVKASQPMGAGYFHYNPNQEFLPEHFKVEDNKVNPGLFLDYVGGRMVKFQVWKKGENEWETYSGNAKLDYQSWGVTYPTYEDLLKAGGIQW